MSPDQDVDTAVRTNPGETAASDCAEGMIETLCSYSTPAWQVAVRILGSREGAEDVVQQAYLAALPRLRSGPPPLNLRNWFLGVVANTARKHIRSEIHRRTREKAMVGINRQEDQNSEPELVLRVQEAMSGLKESERLAVALCCEQGLSQAEAAEVLRVSQRTVSSYVSQGLESLRRTLSSQGYASIAPATLLLTLRDTAPAAPAHLATSIKVAVAKSMTSTGTALGSAAAAIVKIGAAVLLATTLGVGIYATASHVRQQALPTGNPPNPTTATVNQTLEVSGTVLDPAGKPVSGVDIALSAPAGSQRCRMHGRSGNDGHFAVAVPADRDLWLETMELPKGCALVLSEVVGGEFIRQNGGQIRIPTADKGPAGLILRLGEPTSVMEGTVCDQAGNPLPGALVSVSPLGAGYGRWGCSSIEERLTRICIRERSGLSQADGRYRIAIPAGVYTVSEAIAPEGSALYYSRRPVVAHRLVPTAELNELHSGQMMESHPALGRDGMSDAIFTSSDSTDILTRIGPGQTAVSNLTFFVGGTLAVEVHDPSGKPVPGAHVRQGRGWQLSEPSKPRSAITDLRGACLLPGVHPGTWEIFVSAPEGSALANAMVTSDFAEPGHPLPVVVTLEPGAACTGRVTDPAGKPLPGIRLEVNRPSKTGIGLRPNKAYVTTQADGQYLIEHLPAGSYTIVPESTPVSGQSEAAALYRPITATSAVELSVGQVARHDLTLRPVSSGAISGRVVDGNGHAAAKATVVVSQPTDPRRRISDWQDTRILETSPDGSFQASDLWPGKIRIEVLPPTGAPLHAKEVLVSVDEQATAAADITLESAILLRMHVRDAAGRPASPGPFMLSVDSQIHVVPGADGDGYAGILLPFAPSDPGPSRMAHFIGGHFHTAMEPKEFALNPSAERIVEQAISVSDGGSVVGSVVDANGKPQPWIDVDIITGADWARLSPTNMVIPVYADQPTLRSDDHGRFELANLPPGEYILRLSPRVEFDPLEVAPVRVAVKANTTVEAQIIIATTGSLQGTIRGADPGWSGLHVRLSRPGDSNLIGQPHGVFANYRTALIPPGTYDVHVEYLEPDDRQEWRRAHIPKTEVKIIPGSTTLLDLKVEPTAPSAF